MSFHVEFTAHSLEHARAIVEEEHLPQSVKEFIKAALALPKKEEHGGFFVKAVGHLYTGIGNYEVSTAQIEVKPHYHRVPRDPGLTRFENETSNG